MKGDVKRNNSPMAGQVDTVVVTAKSFYRYGNPSFRQSTVKSCTLFETVVSEN